MGHDISSAGTEVKLKVNANVCATYTTYGVLWAAVIVGFHCDVIGFTFFYFLQGVMLRVMFPPKF